MSAVLIVVLYALAGLSLRAVASLEMNNEVRLTFGILGGIGALVLPIVLYSVIDFKLTRRAVQAVGVKWCRETGAEFTRVETHKSYFALVYRESMKKERKKFRIRFVFSTWHVKSVEWLT